jgi:transposase InsO family protein
VLETSSPEAFFRYQVLSQVLSRLVRGDALARSVDKASEIEYYDSRHQRCRRVSKTSIYRWYRIYEKEGWAGLRSRRSAEASEITKVLPPRFLDFLINEKDADSRSSIPQIIKRAREYGILKPGERVDRTTVYRTAKRLGLSVSHRKKGKDRDSRRFAFPHRLDMVLSDGKHFRAGGKRARRVAFFFLDDATRFALHVVVGTSENAELFQRGLYEFALKYGYFSAIYLDRGPGFIALDTARVIENLGASLIQGEDAYPQGHGKIERFNRTAKADLLRGFDRRPDVDPTPEALELRIQHYFDNDYNVRPHESLGGDSPYESFRKDPKPLRFPEDRHVLRRSFEVYLSRRVSRDHIVSVDSTPYEMPRGYDGRKVLLRRKLLAPGGIFFLHRGTLIELHPVDLEANARSRRARGRKEPEEVDRPLPKSAADIAYDRDFGPVVDLDGGLPRSNPKEET